MIDFRDVNRIVHFESLFSLCCVLFFFGDAHAACAWGMAKQGPVQAQDFARFLFDLPTGACCQVLL